MRPTDFCTPKQSNSSTLASPLPSVAILIPRPEPFGARARGPHSYRALRLVPVHAKRPLFALPLRESGDSRSRHRSSGHPMRTRLGRIAVHNAILTSTTVRASRGGVFFPRARPSRPPLAPLSPPPCSLARGSLWASSMPWLGGRQDRFRGGPVKGVRFPDPRCLPPLDAPRNPPAPKCGRTHGASPEDAALT